MCAATAETKRFYDLDAEDYDRRWQRPGGRHTAVVQARIVENACRSWSGRRVLEVGCGTGRFSHLLTSLGVRLTVVDISEAMLRATGKRLQMALGKDQPRLLNASAYTLPCAAASFEGAVLLNVLGHLEHPRDALAELHRALTAGGRLLVNYANLCSYYFFPALAINIRRRAVGAGVYSVWRRPQTMLGLLQEAGFEVQRIVGHVHVPKWLDLPVVRALLYWLDGASHAGSLARYAPVWFVDCVARKAGGSE
jgi:SAM-dependent methyltransferase